VPVATSDTVGTTSLFVDVIADMEPRCLSYSSLDSANVILGSVV
jgi:hypothetical protein